MRSDRLGGMTEMNSNAARTNSTVSGSAPVSARYANASKKNEIRCVVAGGMAWNTELVQYKTTHGPMDVRIWRASK